MDVSVVIATHDQRERLGLVLHGLEAQSVTAADFEVVVVDDGCTDGTADMLESWTGPLQLRNVTLRPNRGRCAARNAGVHAARGRWVAFLDGDALPHPGWLEAHLAACGASGSPRLRCGAEYCLPLVEYLQEPAMGTVVDGDVPSVLREYVRHHRDEMVVTSDMIREDFGCIETMAKEGGYPVPGVEKLQQHARDLLSERPNSAVAWTAFYPHNGMVERETFLAAGGFDEKIPFSEGWELAYRLQQAGAQPVFVQAAKTYHLYHYHPFADPARAQEETRTRMRAVEHMAAKHGEDRLRLIPFWLAGIWPDPFLPEEMVLADLFEFDRVWREATVEQLDDCRRVLEWHPLYRGELVRA